MPIIVGGFPNPAPYAPTLVTPPNASYADLSGTPTFVWIYNPAQPTLTQSSWQFRRKISGAASYLFWNAATSSWQSTAIWNPSSSAVAGAANQWSYTFPSAAWSDGDLYNWSVASQDTNGMSPFATDSVVTAQQPPVVTVLSPGGTVTTADPLVTWSMSIPAGASQSGYEVILYNAAQYGASGFTPGVGPSIYDTGVVGSAYTVSFDPSTIPIYLPDNAQYRAYVQVSETGGQLSAWAYSAFTTAFAAPAAPTITATAGTDPATGCPRIALVVEGHDNLLSIDDANPTLGIGTWAAVTNCAVASTSTGLELTSTAAGLMSASTAETYAVQPDVAFTALASFMAGYTDEECTVAINWYTSAGALISTSTGAVLSPDEPTVFQQTYVNATSPGTAAFASVVVTVLSTAAASEVHYVKGVGLFVGTTSTWTPGGFTGLTQCIITRSDGLYVRGASAVNPASVQGSGSVATTVYDYEAIPTIEYTYSAILLVSYGQNQTVVSVPTVSNSVAESTTQWWELDPTDPSTAVPAQPTQFEPQVTEQSTAHLVMGQATPNVIANAMGGQDGQATFETFTAAIYAGFQVLLQSQKTLFLSNPYGDPIGVTYVRFGPQTGGLSTGTGNKVKDTTLMPSTAAAPYHSSQVTWVAQPRPPV